MFVVTYYWGAGGLVIRLVEQQDFYCKTLVSRNCNTVYANSHPVFTVGPLLAGSGQKVQVLTWLETLF